MVEAGGEGQTLASPSPGPGDQGKPKQKLKIRLGGKLFAADDGKPSATASADDSTQHAPPHSSSAKPMSDSVPPSSSPSPSPASDMLIDPASDLQQMECQTRLDSLNMAAEPDAVPSQTPTSNPSQQPTSSDAPSSTHPSADTATAPIGQAQQSPALHHSGANDTAHGHEPASHSFHSSLGSGSALGAVVADAPQAPPRSSPADEHATSPPSVSGYYRPERGAVRGVLLALETQGRGQVAVYRPATGSAARPMRLAELQDK